MYEKLVVSQRKPDGFDLTRCDVYAFPPTGSGKWACVDPGKQKLCERWWGDHVTGRSRGWCPGHLEKWEDFI